MCFYGEKVAPGPLACALVRDTKSKHWIYYRWRGFHGVQLGFCWPIEIIDKIYFKYHLSSKLGMGHSYSSASIGNCLGGTIHNLGISTSPWLYFSWCLKKMWLKCGSVPDCRFWTISVTMYFIFSQVCSQNQHWKTLDTELSLGGGWCLASSQDNQLVGF